MKDYEELGHMQPVTTSDGQPCYYLPHHPVFKEKSPTKRTRVIFDGSAKSSNGLSFNDILQVGPTVQPDLYLTMNLEARNVHLALNNQHEDFTQRFSNLNRLPRVTAYCRRFVYNCRHELANRQFTALTTQDLV